MKEDGPGKKKEKKNAMEPIRPKQRLDRKPIGGGRNEAPHRLHAGMLML